MKVSIELSPEYSEPYAIIYADKITDNIQRTLDIFGSNESPITALQNENDIVILQPKEIYMVRVENKDTIIYGKEHRYRSRKRLYEMQQQLGAGFMQISKSTLVNLIPRFYDVTGGQITLDGKDIRRISMEELREEIGFVPQKGVLFSGTIASNLRFGKADATDEDIKEAAEIAQATEFIETKKEKYDSPIAQGGSNVSGGQKQRLSIARAIAKNPKIFIFDDSFSALDLKTDAALRKALGENVCDSTMIIVAQRVSTILHAEQIIVLDEGRIAGIGTHGQLLENCEVYKEIAMSQLSEEELKNAGKEEN